VQLLDWLERRGITGRVVLQAMGNCARALGGGGLRVRAVGMYGLIGELGEEVE
jgi:hypothetical protein